MFPHNRRGSCRFHIGMAPAQTDAAAGRAVRQSKIQNRKSKMALWLLAVIVLAVGMPPARRCGRCRGEAAGAAEPAAGRQAWDAPWAPGGNAAARRLSMPDPRWLGAYPVTAPRTYAGRNLEYVLMPIGGIGTGTIWLDGQGRLAVWQIFNNSSETRVQDSFLAVRAQAAGQPAVTRILQSVPEAGFPAMESLEYEGGYPIARLRFRDAALPVSVLLEASNPMIPTDAANSALPCAIFRVTAKNTAGVPVHVDLLASLQNGVGSLGAGSTGVHSPGYGGNREELVRDRSMTTLFLHQGIGDLAPGLLKVRDASGAQVAGPELLWVDRLGSPAQVATAGPRAVSAVETMLRLSREGGAIVAAGVTPEFFHTLAATREKRSRWNELEVFDDFEKGSYAGWSVKGSAFGPAPHTGTSPGQQPVSGFFGKGLINTYRPDDGPQGEMLSRPFPIHRRYIGFLVGGGNHPGETCINLLVEGRVARTATGRNLERLEAAAWDVREFAGKEGVLQILDRHSGGWGHINVDHIVFSDTAPETLMRFDGPVEMVAAGLPLAAAGATPATAPEGSHVQPGSGGLPALPARSDRFYRSDLSDRAGRTEWPLAGFTRVAGLQAAPAADTPGETPAAGAAAPFRVLAAAPDGSPLVLMTPFGKTALVLCLAPDPPRAWLTHLLAVASGRALRPGERLVPWAAGHGSMALAAPHRSARAGRWTDPEALLRAFSASGTPPAEGVASPTPVGRTTNAALSVPLNLPAGGEGSATFVVAWHFPNVERHGHAGNLYNRRFPDALAVARYVTRNAAALWERTRLYHATFYQSNLPEEWLDAAGSQSVIFRGPTAFWAEDGYFAGYEGCYGCCPLNCTHVWNYAQSHARLFPQVGRNLRESDLLVYLRPDGETSHRQHQVHGAFIDGHAATIEAALREHQLSPDRRFLERVWPNLKKATDWMIERIDGDHDGVPAGHQPNTYDCSVSGANTFIGSQYLSALAAAERLAAAMEEAQTAARWRAVREAGMRNQEARLWNGEHYIQVPDARPAHDYNTGCHSDQLLGQWWAHQLGLGYLYPREHVRTALQAVMRHNFREQFAGFKQAPRRYVPDDEGGLLMCTWPKGGRPSPFTIYADEVWTGIEYAVAGQMIYEGMIPEARRIVKMARSRYDGRRRDGLNSGPGGNPFNELECGKFYARAMSSWGLLLAAQGQVLDGPAGVLGFKPHWQPEEHRSFFTAPEAWGLFVQQRNGQRQSERIEVRHGVLRLRELVFALPETAGRVEAHVRIAGRPVGIRPARAGEEIRLRLERPAEVKEGRVVDVSLRWQQVTPSPHLPATQAFVAPRH